MKPIAPIALLPRLYKVVHWLLFGTYDWKPQLVALIEFIMKEGQNVEIVANTKGEFTVKYHKEI